MCWMTGVKGCAHHSMWGDVVCVCGVCVCGYICEVYDVFIFMHVEAKGWCRVFLVALHLRYFSSHWTWSSLIWLDCMVNKKRDPLFSTIPEQGCSLLLCFYCFLILMWLLLIGLNCSHLWMQNVTTWAVSLIPIHNLCISNIINLDARVFLKKL